MPTRTHDKLGELDLRVSELLELRETIPDKPLAEIRAIYETQLREGKKLRIRPPFKRLLPGALAFLTDLVSAEYQPLAMELLLTGEHSSCSVCGVPVWKHRNHCMRAACHSKLSNKDQARAKRVKTMQERYGVNHPGQVESGKEKARQTNLQRYGVRNPSQSEEVKRKKRDTSKKNWGSDHYFSSSEGRKAVEKGMLAKHGVINPGQTERLRRISGKRFADPEIQKKIEHTNLQKYGVRNPIQDRQVKAKANRTVHERYGVLNVSQAPSVILKKRSTSLQNYGVPHPSQAIEVKEQIVKTNLKRYGVPVTTMSPEVRQRVEETNIKRYGGHPWSNEEVRKKVEQTNVEKYGFPYPNQNYEQFLKNQRNAFKRVEYTTREGTTLTLQGSAEPAVARYLENQGVTLLGGKPARIPYVGLNGKEHYYHPDFKVKHKGKFALVEVKSTYTLEADFKRNVLKFAAARVYCEDLGIRFLVVVPTLRGIRVLKDTSKKALERFLNQLKKG